MSERLEALTQLKNALETASKLGLLDELGSFTTPEVVNFFCDGVNEILKHKPADTNCAQCGNRIQHIVELGVWRHIEGDFRHRAKPK